MLRPVQGGRVSSAEGIAFREEGATAKALRQAFVCLKKGMKGSVRGWMWAGEWGKVTVEDRGHSYVMQDFVHGFAWHLKVSALFTLILLLISSQMSSQVKDAVSMWFSKYGSWTR